MRNNEPERTTKMKRRINKTKLEAYRKANRKEIFLGQHEKYDITLANFLRETNPNEITDDVNVDELAKQCGMDHLPVDEADGYQYFQCEGSSRQVEIHVEHFLKELDLKKPLICLPSGEIIDGHHRLYRAFMTGVEMLEVYTLSEDEAELCCNARLLQQRLGV
jgi:hypothetical protein